MSGYGMQQWCYEGFMEVSWGRRTTERASGDQYCSRMENSKCCDLSAIKQDLDGEAGQNTKPGEQRYVAVICVRAVEERCWKSSLTTGSRTCWEQHPSGTSQFVWNEHLRAATSSLLWHCAVGNVSFMDFTGRPFPNCCRGMRSGSFENISMALSRVLYVFPFLNVCGTFERQGSLLCWDILCFRCGKPNVFGVNNTEFTSMAKTSA